MGSERTIGAQAASFAELEIKRGQQFPPSDDDRHTPLRARCVKVTIPCHERVVFTFEGGWTAALAAQPKDERLSPVSPLASSVQGMTE